MTLALFDLEEPRISVIPACDVCGARGPRLEEHPKAGGFNGAVLFALVEIASHKKEMHPVPAVSA